jgi:hypothetical protein
MYDDVLSELLYKQVSEKTLALHEPSLDDGKRSLTASTLKKKDLPSATSLHKRNPLSLSLLVATPGPTNGVLGGVEGAVHGTATDLAGRRDLGDQTFLSSSLRAGRGELGSIRAGTGEKSTAKAVRSWLNEHQTTRGRPQT